MPAPAHTSDLPPSANGTRARQSAERAPDKDTDTGTRRRRPLTLSRLAFEALVIVIGVAALAPFTTMLIHGALARPTKSDVIVVPGAALRDGGRRLSDALQWRMDRAIRLYHEGYAPVMVLSGGGEGAWNEPRAMARYASEHGVPDDAIVLDLAGDTSRATGDNVAAMMHRAGAKRALVVSQWYHVPRVRMALEQAGVDTCGAPADHPRFLRREPRFVLREAVGVYAYATGLDRHDTLRNAR